MPNIIIREKDYTSPGTEAYENFTVLVPGFIATNKTAAYKKACEAQGEVDTCLFTSVTDFVSAAGCVPVIETATTIAAVGPTFTLKAMQGAEQSILETYQNNIYTYSSEASTGIGKLDDGEHKYVLVNYSTINFEKYFAADTTYYVVDSEESGYKKTTDASPVSGTQYYIKTITEKYEAATLPEKTTGDKYYAVIKNGNEGNDLISATIGSYGNQIAYELLKMGYPVLYKKITEIADLEDSATFEQFYDKANYDFRYVITGLLDDVNGVATSLICDLATFKDTTAVGRGDCTALVDIPESLYRDKTTQAEVIEAIVGGANAIPGDKYTAIFAPSICYSMSGRPDEYNENNKFPGYFHYLACAMYAKNHNFAEWYAVAGYTRGICDLVIDSTSVKLGEAAIRKLEARNTKDTTCSQKAVNVIMYCRGNYYLWGNRTAETLTNDDLVASHFLNIRQLCTTLKKDIYVACRRFTFDPNSDLLWANFCAAIRPTLETMKGDQGIKDYQIVKVTSTAKATLKAKVRIIPIEAVEDFDITVTLEDSFGTTSATVTE